MKIEKKHVFLLNVVIKEKAISYLNTQVNHDLSPCPTISDISDQAISYNQLALGDNVLSNIRDLLLSINKGN